MFLLSFLTDRWWRWICLDAWEKGGEGTTAERRLSLNGILMDFRSEFQTGQPTAKKLSLMQVNFIAVADVLPAVFFQQKCVC